MKSRTLFLIGCVITVLASVLWIAIDFKVNGKWLREYDFSYSPRVLFSRHTLPLIWLHDRFVAIVVIFISALVGGLNFALSDSLRKGNKKVYY